MNVADFNIAGYLAVLPLFSDLSPAELSRVAQGCQVRRLARGDTIFRYGEPCEEFHVVVSGQVKLFALSAAGQEKVIELVSPGHSFAEALMFTSKPYILNAQALARAFQEDVFRIPILHGLGHQRAHFGHVLRALLVAGELRIAQRLVAEQVRERLRRHGAAGLEREIALACGHRRARERILHGQTPPLDRAHEGVVGLAGDEFGGQAFLDRQIHVVTDAVLLGSSEGGERCVGGFSPPQKYDWFSPCSAARDRQRRDLHDAAHGLVHHVAAR
jgi:CRP-like cAMP-binding protein